jgi:hypothetical protein
MRPIYKNLANFEEPHTSKTTSQIRENRSRKCVRVFLRQDFSGQAVDLNFCGRFVAGFY